MPTTNTLFAIFAVTDAAALEIRLQTIAPWLAWKAAEGQWLIIAPQATTTKELSDRLGITDGSVSGGIVVRVENYYGRASTSVWEWVATKMGAELGNPTSA